MERKHTLNKKYQLRYNHKLANIPDHSIVTLSTLLCKGVKFAKFVGILARIGLNQIHFH